MNLTAESPHSRRDGFPRRARVLFGIVALAGSTWIAGCGGSAAQSDAQQASAALSAGLLAQNQGKTQEAINDYNKVLAHDPKNKYAYYDLGLIDQQAGRNDSAEKRYRSALTVDPQFEPALFNLAILRTVPSRSEAENLYRQVITVDAKNAAAHLNLGFVLKSEGRTDEASAEFATAVALDAQLAPRVPAPAPSPSPSPR
ncbi:MAG TPA: tetratricopeptide repeat protein [Candidatus Dormibacteraeota bacterium]